VKSSLRIKLSFSLLTSLVFFVVFYWSQGYEVHEEFVKQAVMSAHVQQLYVVLWTEGNNFDVLGSTYELQHVKVLA